MMRKKMRKNLILNKYHINSPPIRTSSYCHSPTQPKLNSTRVGLTTLLLSYPPHPTPPHPTAMACSRISATLLGCVAASALLATASALPTAPHRARRGLCFICSPETSSGRRSWWAPLGDCRCREGYEGACCDQPKVCATESKHYCPQARLAEKSHTCSAVDKSGPIRIGGPELPTSLQGVFWLTDQKDSSALMSFAATNDGGGISTGVLTGDDYYRVRVDGDRSWSFHDKTTNYGLVRGLDLVYNFKFGRTADGSDVNTMTIYPQALNLPGDPTLTFDWLLSFTADAYPKGTHTKYSESVVWLRESAVLGQAVASKDYDLVQVMDARGNKIQPAFDDWVAYCESGETGSSPGQVFYHAA